MVGYHIFARHFNGTCVTLRHTVIYSYEINRLLPNPFVSYRRTKRIDQRQEKIWVSKRDRFKLHFFLLLTSDPFELRLERRGRDHSGMESSFTVGTRTWDLASRSLSWRQPLMVAPWPGSLANTKKKFGYDWFKAFFCGQSIFRPCISLPFSSLRYGRNVATMDKSSNLVRVSSHSIQTTSKLSFRDIPSANWNDSCIHSFSPLDAAHILFNRTRTVVRQSLRVGSRERVERY